MGNICTFEVRAADAPPQWVMDRLEGVIRLPGVPPPKLPGVIPKLPGVPPAAKRRVTLFDLECYPNYFLTKFQDYETGKRTEFPMWPGKALDIQGVLHMISSCTLVGFNSDHYDCPMLSLALTGATCEQLKAANDAIIVGGLKPWQFRDTYQCYMPSDTDHYDISEVTPGVKISLKLYGGRAHSKRIQDLPIDPSHSITPFQRVQLSQYCGNDLDTTGDVLRTIMPRVELRVALSKQYGVDLRSKSDAQIAEAVIKAQLGFKPQKRFVPHGHSFRYRPPGFISFQTSQMQEIFRTVLAGEFIVSDKDQVDGEYEDSQGKKVKTGIIIPDAIKAIRVKMGGSVYKFGIGGLHSQESKAAHYAIPGVNSLSEHDALSFYPSMILILGVFPEQLGAKFLEIYRNIYDNRVKAKHAIPVLQEKLKTLTDAAEIAKVKQELADAKVINDSSKLSLNGTFGKLGSKYSILFAPEQLIQITITGQLLLLMLIESLEICKIPVVSANTDGIVLKTPVGMEWLRDHCIKQWETVTGIEIETNEYSSIFSQNVNNYIAFKPDGSSKAKGFFTKPGISENKTPHRAICADAVIAYLGKGIPIERTVMECQDIRKFLTVRNVKGGGIKRYVGTDEAPAERVDELGKVVRWVYRKGETTGIYYKTNGNQVADSVGAWPVMELPDTLPDWIDYDYYIRHAKEMLIDLGVS